MEGIQGGGKSVESFWKADITLGQWHGKHGKGGGRGG